MPGADAVSGATKRYLREFKVSESTEEGEGTVLRVRYATIGTHTCCCSTSRRNAAAENPR